MSKYKDRHPSKYAEACVALEAFLEGLWKVPEGVGVEVYSFYDPDDGFRIGEINIRNERGGTSMMRGTADEQILSLILACEDFVRSFHIKPYRPRGWVSELDEHGDAKWVIEELLNKWTKE